MQDQSLVFSPSLLQCNVSAEFTSPSERKTFYSDRYIPSCVKRSIDFSNVPNIPKFETPEKKYSENNNKVLAHPISAIEKQRKELYKVVLENELLGCKIEKMNSQFGSSDYILDNTDRVYHFSYKKSPESSPNMFITSPNNHLSPSSQKLLKTRLRKYRFISPQPYKILDAPGLSNDFYLNLLDWSKKGIIAVFLKSRVYLWVSHTGSVSKLSDYKDVTYGISSVSWSKMNPMVLALGTTDGYVQVYDVESNYRIRCNSIQDEQRIGCMSWNDNLLSLGCRSGRVYHLDMRTKNDIFHSGRLHDGHSMEVCGLRWDMQGKNLASGGNDNKVFIWDLRNQSSVIEFNEHKGAVKAMAWSPHQNGLLATAGGSADRTVKFWNVVTSQLMSTINTNSQVCNLEWSPYTSELVTSHGFTCNNLNVWNYPSLEKLATLTGHSSRVVYMAASPCGEKVVTGSGDQTIRFWNVFGATTTSYNSNQHYSVVNSLCNLR